MSICLSSAISCTNAYNDVEDDVVVEFRLDLGDVGVEILVKLGPCLGIVAYALHEQFILCMKTVYAAE